MSKVYKIANQEEFAHFQKAAFATGKEWKNTGTEIKEINVYPLYVLVDPHPYLFWSNSNLYCAEKNAIEYGLKPARENLNPKNGKVPKHRNPVEIRRFNGGWIRCKDILEASKRMGKNWNGVRQKMAKDKRWRDGWEIRWADDEK